ncbi:Mut7-C RNAse domain-containing protein [Corallincola spongiicola]|uniref:Mut7-C RNAse domain-containing protein n=1 Tax=Corallincola spongiicola TaxID=2520508 RepID=A0ABY1WP95_9GAMM|nr:Mut7-C RNAse domain-containing protein [Corallincola spongiicola]TAA45824.1 hypothetical protein EXY25_10725 [Corallincola spongiicola]
MIYNECTTQAPRFYCDAMLGGTARWLRLLGFDTRFHPSIDDKVLAQHANLEQRILLTRDKRLPDEQRPDRVYLVLGNKVDEQMRELVTRFHLNLTATPFSRCSCCNQRLRPCSPEEMKLKLPADMASPPQAGFICPACGRCYWMGSHVARIRQRMAGFSDAFAMES